MSKIPFLWTNDDISCGGSEAMSRQLEFLSRFDLKGTFFVVPIPKGERPLTDDPKLIDLLKQAAADGHEMHQHSVTHECIENGTADLRMYDLMGDQAKMIYSRDRLLWERLWQVDALEAHIGWGRQIWIDAFGEGSPGYRPGCGSFCGNMYRALENLGFKWSSSRLVSLTGWQWAFERYDYPIALEEPKRPYRHGKLIEFPIIDDVAFRLPREKVDDFVELGWRLWELCVAEQVPFTLVCHPGPLAREDGVGYAVHEKLLPRILASGHAEPMTMDAYYRRIEAGEWPVSENELVAPADDRLPEWHALRRAATTSGSQR